jgi:hypothetical protein
VEIEGVDQTITTNYTIETSPSQRINLSNPTTALAGGELVRIKRRSAPNTNLVDFQNGSVLTESELDRAYLHNRYLAEEATEGADSGLKELEGSTNYNAGNKQIKNLADGTLATDAVNKGYVDTQIALTDTNLAGFYKSTHTGNGTDNVFTLSFTPQTTDAKAYIVSIDGLVQVPDTDYTIGATAITFNTIPSNSAEICVVATAAASVATVNEARVTALGTSDTRSLATWTRDLGTPTATGSTTARSLADRFGDVINVLDYGATGDYHPTNNPTADDTTAIQNALYAASGGEPSNTQINPAITAKTVFIPAGTYRITNQIHHPPWVTVVGESSGALDTYGLSDFSATGSIIYADFTDTDKTAWLASGYVVNSRIDLPAVGELVDVYQNNINSGHYDDGDITRAYGVSIKDVIFYTDKYVACAFGCGASQGAQVDITAHGFLTAFITNSSWGVNVRVVGSAYHCGIFTWNSNGGVYSGYVTLITSGSPPALDDTTAPDGWYPEDVLHNPASIRFLTTGYYNVYANSNVLTNLITEKWGRARLFINVEGATDNSPYVEAITELPYHVVASRVTITDPQFNSVLNGLGRVSSSGSLVVKNMKLGIKADYGSQTSFGAEARLSVTYPRQSYVADAETFNSAVDMHFEHEKVIKIYVDAQGNDTYCGLTPNNAVRSFNVAIDRAIYYDADVIYISDGEIVYYGSAVKTLTKDLRVQAVTSGAAAVIRIEAGTDGYSNHLVLDSMKLTLKNIDLRLNGTWSGSHSTKGWITPRGVCGLVLDSSAVTVADDPTNLSLFLLDGNSSATLHLSAMNGSYTGNNWAENDFSSTGVGKVVASIASNFTTSAVWGSTWTVY